MNDRVFIRQTYARRFFLNAGTNVIGQKKCVNGDDNREGTACADRHSPIFPFSFRKINFLHHELRNLSDTLG